MEGYDIDKIELSSDKDPSTEELLTGKYITGLDTTAEVTPNAELEGGEYIQFPDGTTQLVAGENHEKGGVKMFIPDGSRIVSKSLFPTKNQVKLLKDDFGLNVSAKDSYANIITKYSKLIGLEKNYEEQEKMYEMVKREQDKEMPDSTRNINQEYLSGKVSELDKQAQRLEKDKAQFFNTVFDMQEVSKPASKRIKGQEGSMEYGGVSEQQFRALCKEHGITYEQGLSFLKAQTPTKFEGGGELDKLKEIYKSEDEVEAALDRGEITKQQYNELANWYISQSNQFNSGDLEGVDYDKPAGAGKRVSYPYEESEAYGPEGVKRLNTFREQYKLKPIDPNSTEAQIRQAAGELQAHMGDKFPELVFDYMVTKSHKPNKKLEAKLIEINKSKNKNYTIDNEGLKAALDAGDITKDDVVKGYRDDLWWYRALDIKEEPVSREQYEKLMKREGAIKQGEDLYFAEDPENPEVYTKYVPRDPEKEPAPEEKKDQPAAGVEEKGITPPKRYFPRLFATPNQYPLPPSPMESHLMGETRFQRMDPIRIGIEPQIQEAGQQRKFLAEQMFGNLAPNVAASVMASEMARQTMAINQEARAANMVNVNNLASTELFNIGQAGKEQEARLRNLLSFEQRQLAAKSNTEEEIRNFYDQVRRIQINDYKTNQNLNMLNQMFPDYNLASTGMTVDYEPSSNYQVQDNPFFGMFGEGPFV